MANDLLTLLDQAVKNNRLSLSKAVTHQLVLFLEMITAWNRVFNLTTILKPHDMIYLHLIDSLIIAPYLKGERFLDVGSGAGLPGIPLAILNPHQQWTLLDKSSKKTRFLTQVIATLGLTNVEIVHGRAEEFHPTACFDGILSRAFGTINLFVESTAHLLCPQGLFLAMKGKYPEEELNDISERFIVTDIARLDIKGINVLRHVVVLTKKHEHAQ